MFAVFDQPDLKASFRFTITAPSHWEFLSNAPTPEPVVDGDHATWAFEPGPVMSSYIVALVAGPYASWRDRATSVDGREIPLGLFTRASLAQHADPEVMFETVKAGLAFYEQAFGVPYPFGKYDQIFVPEYNWGAMENVGAVTFNESYLFRARVSDARREQRAIVVLHELSHMWFGNSVTMKWWNDLWLNESFATWASTLATSQITEFTGVWATFASDEKTHAAEQDQLPSTHPIVAVIDDLADVEVNFDAITYDKGASVLKQLVAFVGLDAFQQGVGAYLAAHASGNATLRDLLDELERASGRELTRWSQLWLETAGVNTLRAVVETDASGTITAARVEQSAATQHPTLRPHRVALGSYTLDGSALTRTHRVELDIDGPSTEVPELVGLPRPDLLLVNDDDLTYAKVRLDDRSFAVADRTPRRHRRPGRSRGRARVGLGRRARRRTRAARVRAPRGREHRPRDPVGRPRPRARAPRDRAQPLPRRGAPRADRRRGRRRRVGARRTGRRRLRHAAAVREGVHPHRLDMPRTPTCSAACSTGRSGSPGSRSTSTCGGTSSSPAPRSAPATMKSSPTRCVATTPPRGASSPRPRGPAAPIRHPRTPPGSGS